MYLILRSLKQKDKKIVIIFQYNNYFKDYKLKQYDIIKVGRIKLKVKEIVIKSVE